MADGKRALLVIDLQNGVNPLYRANEVVNAANQRIAEFRANDEASIFIRHNGAGLVKGTREWEFVPYLDIAPTDSVIHKTQQNAFYCTSLKQKLDDLGVDSLEICGAQTECCVDATIKATYYMGYKIAVTKGGFSTIDGEILDAEEINAFYSAMWERLCERSPLQPI